MRVHTDHGIPFPAQLVLGQWCHISEKLTILGKEQCAMNVIHATPDAVPGPVRWQMYIYVGTSRGVVETTIVPMITKTALAPSGHALVQLKVAERYTNGDAVYCFGGGTVKIIVVCVGILPGGQDNNLEIIHQPWRQIVGGHGSRKRRDKGFPRHDCPDWLLLFGCGFEVE